jgi:hypothetical protein
MSTEESVYSTQITFNLNGLVNASPVGLQSPTITIPQLPFGPWGALSTPRTVSGQIQGVLDPDQYQVGLFAVESPAQFLGGPSWQTSVAADGSFSLAVPQSAGSYVALLMTTDFASQYYAGAFPGGSGTVSTLPSPTESPGQVLMEVQIPAALNRYLGIQDSSLPPGEALLYPIERNTNSQNLPPGTLDPTVSSNYPQLWNELMGSPASFVIAAQNASGQGTGGALVLGLYIYDNQLFLMFGASGPDISPQFVSTVLVNWTAFAPQMIQVGLAVTVLSTGLQVAIDQLNVQESAIPEILAALEEIAAEFMEVLFSLL